MLFFQHMSWIIHWRHRYVFLWNLYRSGRCVWKSEIKWPPNGHWMAKIRFLPSHPYTEKKIIIIMSCLNLCNLSQVYVANVEIWARSRTAKLLCQPKINEQNYFGHSTESDWMCVAHFMKNGNGVYRTNDMKSDWAESEQGITEMMRWQYLGIGSNGIGYVRCVIIFPWCYTFLDLYTLNKSTGHRSRCCFVRNANPPKASLFDNQQHTHNRNEIKM